MELTEAEIGVKLTEIAETLEDLGASLAVNLPPDDPRALAVALAGYALRRVGSDRGAVLSYEDEDDVPSWVALCNRLREILPSTDPNR